MSTTAAPTHPAAAYHRRRFTTNTERINDAARALLRRGGLKALTVERLAEETGIAKTTLYRRGENALDLAVAALPHDNARNWGGMVALLVDQARKIADEQLDEGATRTDLDAATEVMLAAALKRMQDQRHTPKGTKTK